MKWLLVALLAVQALGQPALLRALDKALDYLQDNIEHCNVDCLFGLNFARALLEKDNFKLNKLALQVTQRLDLNHSWVHDMIDYKLWKARPAYKLLGAPPPVQSSYKATIPKVSTDHCFQNVINNTLTMQPKTCHLNKDCIKGYLSYDLLDDYLLTHQLLLVQLIRARQCQVDLSILTDQICNKIFLNTMALLAERPQNYFDLFLEQIVLCGYEGYINFLRSDFLKAILKAQHRNGCFSVNFNPEVRSRRNIHFYEDGCTDHSSGLGIAALSLFF